MNALGGWGRSGQPHAKTVAASGTGQRVALKRDGRQSQGLKPHGADPTLTLHTNGSENDIRCQVTRRKVSAGTRSDTGRDCRDAVLGLAKTCAKHGVAFRDYLRSRFNVPGQLAVPPLPDLIRCRGQPA